MKKFLLLTNFLGFHFEKDEDYPRRNSLKFKILPLNWLIVIIGSYLVLTILFGSWFVLDKTEKGSVEYFGKFDHEVGPGGVHFKIPIISRVRKVATEIRYRWELGFRTITTDGELNPNDYEDKPEEAVMLTKGGAIASVYWIIQYTINDIYNWLYQVKDPEDVIDKLSQGSMRLIIGKTDIDDLLTTQKIEIQIKNKELLQRYCDEIGLKVTINEVKLQDCGLPNPEVKEAYDGVMNSIKAKERMIKEGAEYANKKIPKAQGDAAVITNQANSYYTIQVNAAEGEVARFMGLYEEYKKDPKTTREKLWYEAMQEVMPNGKKTIINKNALINLKNL